MTETYGHRDNSAIDRFFAERSAAREAAFFLPHLTPGMRLLDCGFGTGSITVGLAEAIAPGEVVGIDLEARQVEPARRLAHERGVTNVTFQQGDIYALPFPDASFDATFAHAVLFHLRDPLAALRELRRVLRPGGVVGIRDGDEGATLMAPSTPLLEELQALQLRTARHRGANPFYAREQRRLLREAGFARSEGSASIAGGGTAEATRRYAALLLARHEGPAGLIAIAVGEGWVTREHLETMRAELQAWGDRPDSFISLTMCAAVGWVD